MSETQQSKETPSRSKLFKEGRASYCSRCGQIAEHLKPHDADPEAWGTHRLSLCASCSKDSLGKEVELLTPFKFALYLETYIGVKQTSKGDWLVELIDTYQPFTPGAKNGKVYMGEGRTLKEAVQHLISQISRKEMFCRMSKKEVKIPILDVLR